MKDLVKIIKENPGCKAIIDNDGWVLVKNEPEPEGWDEWTDDAKFAWEEGQELARDGDVESLGDGGYGSGNCYGGDILQALAIIVGIKVESV